MQRSRDPTKEGCAIPRLVERERFSGGKLGLAPRQQSRCTRGRPCAREWLASRHRALHPRPRAHAPPAVGRSRSSLRFQLRPQRFAFVVAGRRQICSKRRRSSSVADTRRMRATSASLLRSVPSDFPPPSPADQRSHPRSGTPVEIAAVARHRLDDLSASAYRTGAGTRMRSARRCRR